MAVEPFVVPHFSIPFNFDPTTRHANMVEQDSDDDVANSVLAALLTMRGSRLYVANFGISDYMFTAMPIDTEALLAEIQASEPRADAEILRQVIDMDLSESVQVGVASIVN